MADNPFQSLAGEVKSKLKIEQDQLVSCQSVMNNVVKAAFRDARAVISHPRIRWGEGERPSVRVEGEYKNDLSYTCKGTTLEVTLTEGGGDASHSFPVEKVSKDLIVKEIEGFLRQALDIKA